MMRKERILFALSLCALLGSRLGAVASVLAPPLPPTLTIEVDAEERHQTMWGYGAALTDGCIANLDRLTAPERSKLLDEIFDQDQGAGFNYLRVPIGANDFSSSEYTFDDRPANAPDPDLEHFDFSREAEAISYLKAVKRINPELQLMASPWSAPAWMKSTGVLDGGVLLPEYYASYAAYLVKALEAFAAAGVPIDNFSALNEPLIGSAATHWGYPQMYMSETEMDKFLTGYLDPLLDRERQAGRLSVKLLLHDHNWNNASYVGGLLDDPTIASETAGVAFHCYRGTPADMFSAMASHPGVPIFNTECTNMLAAGENNGDFEWWLANESLDVTRGGAVGALGWNLCLDDHGGPQNPGGCAGCRGMVTIHQDHSVTFNEEFEALAQVSRFVRRGAVRIGSTDSSVQGVVNSAFENPDGQIALIMRNSESAPLSVQVNDRDHGFSTQVLLPAGGAAGLVWR